MKIDGDRLRELSPTGTGAAALLVPGNVRGSIRGGRASASSTFVDGQRIIGSPTIPVAIIQTYEVITGGTPVEYGDLTAGTTVITTKGASSEFLYGGQLSTSQFLDPYGFNVLALNATGPIIYMPKRNADGTIMRDSSNKVVRDVKNAKLGFIAAGQFNYIKDGSPAYGGVWKAKDDVRSYLEENPLRASEAGQYFFNSSASFTGKDDFEQVKTKENNWSWDGSFFGRLDYRIDQNTTINGGITYRRAAGTGWGIGNSLFAPDAAGYSTSDNYRAFVRFQQIYTPKNKDSTILKGIVYRVQAEFQRVEGRNYNRDFGFSMDNIFQYGHIGSFYNKRAEAFEVITPNDTRHNPNYSTGSYLQTAGYQDTSWVFDGSNSSNPLLANYNDFIYGYMAQNPRLFPSSTFFPGTDLISYRTSVFNSIDLAQLGGLNNGSAPASIYGMFSAPGTPNWGWGRSQSDMVRVTGQAIFRLARKSVQKDNEKQDSKDEKGYHNIKVGFEFDQRFERSYNLSPSSLWGQMNTLTNRHLQNLDTTNTQPIYDQDGYFTGMVHLDPLYNANFHSTFDKNLRTKLGLSLTGTDWINPMQYSPDMFSLDMFAVEELFNQSFQIVGYRGFDYLGKRTKGDAEGDFFSDLANRPVPAYAPTYVSGYIEDRFELDNINIRLGLRIDRFDNNLPVLKDKYIFMPRYDAGEAKRLGGFELPSYVGDNWIPYIGRKIQPGEIITNASDIIGYRDGINWYDANGSPVNPQLLQVNGRVQPYTKNDSISFDAFTDYKPRVKAMPRMAFSFPITDRSAFNASYDVLAQRPEGANVPTMADYLYIQNRAGGSIANADLGQSTTIDYSVGFSQALDENGFTALEIVAFYREMRDMVQIVRNLNAYPITYDSYENVDFGTVKGFTLSFMAANLGMFSVRTSYTLQFAAGTGSGIGSSSRALNNISGFTILRNQLPLSYDQRHTITGAISMRFDDKRYRGPGIAGYYPLKNVFMQLIYNLGSGTPYTQNALPNPADVVGGVASVFQTKGQPFGSRLPFFSIFDFRIQRTFYFTLIQEKKFEAGHPREGEVMRKGRRMQMDWYVNIPNVFNMKNVFGVYQYSGQWDNSGYLESSFGPRLINSQIDPASFVDQFRIREQNTGNLGSPRQIRLGCVFSF